VEVTEAFFVKTKLFQSKDAGLRRMLYLMIKELSPSADEVGEYWFLHRDSMCLVEFGTDFMHDSLHFLGYHSDQLIDERHE
jgi:hypothetical protein